MPPRRAARRYSPLRHAVRPLLSEQIATCGERTERQDDQEATAVGAWREHCGQDHAGVEHDRPHPAALYVRDQDLVVAVERLERDVDLANGRFLVRQDKTDAGMRDVDMLPLLREILTEHRAQKIQEGLPAGPNDPLLTTRSGKPRDRHNVRQRVVAPVVAKAEQLLAQRGGQPLPQGISPHKLRHTFASVLIAIGKDPTYVMHQLGHTDPAFTLRVYAHIMRRSPQERENLKALVEGHDCTPCAL